MDTKTKSILYYTTYFKYKDWDFGVGEEAFQRAGWAWLLKGSPTEKKPALIGDIVRKGGHFLVAVIIHIRDHFEIIFKVLYFWG